MFTFIYIYLFLYLLTYFFILIYLTCINNFSNITNFYLSSILNMLKKYTKLNPIIIFLFFLTGLPPVGFFFIKFNLLLNIFNNLNFLIFFLIFLNILFTMFFYLQVFTINNKKIKYKITFFKNLKILKNVSYKSTNFKLNFFLSATIFIFFNIFFIYFFSDLYLLFTDYL